MYDKLKMTDSKLQYDILLSWINVSKIINQPI